MAKIAQRIDLSQPTLRKHYFRELTDGRAELKLLLQQAMALAALGGKVGAARYVQAELLAEPKAPAADARPNASADAPIGKKANAEAEARTAHKGTAWEKLVH